MKLSALQQSYLNRRSNSFRGSPPLESTGEASGKSPVTVFWLLLHAACCLISLVLGFRFSRLVFLFLFSASSTNLFSVPFGGGSGAGTETSVTLRAHSSLSSNPIANLENPARRTGLVTGSTGSRVVVGRHGIRIRPWPHPHPDEVMKAHRIIERVQREQRALFGEKNPRTVIAVTPTYVRTFQKLHLTGVMHSLMLVPYDVVWIVVEAGGVSNETASVVGRSGLRTIHIGFNHRMPNSWDARHKLEARMRLHALRFVRKENLDGVVMFADDSNMHSIELFDEIQSVKWIGAVSVGILVHSAGADESSSLKGEEETPPMPVQGPACNATNNLVGWHTFNSLSYTGRSAVYIDDRAPVLPRKLEWSGFVFNSRLLWKDLDDKPDWIKDLEALDDDIDSPLSLLRDTSVVEPLGSCGRQVLLWWLRVEARTDSKFPAQWIIDPPLDITVPSKRTPWPDAPPELPINEKVLIETQEQTTKQLPTKTRTSRARRSRSKRKHDTKVIGVQVSTHSEEN
ncbi:probable beta-1,4-xylosyltransferase IRX14H [Gastrolobium bilobum]|uniref:probable beta-1,4-xylosyltransferase IRX14H n=1 Tax=Gastrolobium bilobum TaxID=150636 RepID=UPI002AAFF6F0|nr:probable beta-1,4-xylosyltransferase IRX14H [Gastrolobium bilobum]